ncbi:protein kinase [Streptomyces sp. CAU 1734]|uniref:protein kinase domain-containing protein n=1 Tax=Streptomyces sp. CAU 1734 TaxID=3140360 RepID=UPI003261C3BE
MSQDGARDRYTGGSLAGGRYQLRDLLGEGGMASVHLAYDAALDRQVAIKTLHTELGREQSFRERFRREAQAVAKLSHPNIVSVFDTGEDTVLLNGAPMGAGAPMPYIVMEYVEGLPLGSVLQADVHRHGAMPAEKALKVAGDVLAALDTSHEVGLVHRDIKPGNVMMTRRDVVKVMDFGIARAMQSGVTSMTQTGMVVGTPQYLSPEQALGRDVDARADLYSVGIMLFQLLTGRLPFTSDVPLAIVYAHVQETPVAPSSINRSVTPAMDALVARALKKNPNERFPSAAAMRDACARAAAAGRPAPPVIIGGPPAASGAGVASAVFPPVDQSAAPPQQRYPHPQQPYPHGQGPYGTASPPPYPNPVPGQGQQGYGRRPAPQYGYPQAPGPHTPAPAYGRGAGTPPPYTAVPVPSHSGGPPGGRKGRGRRTAIIVAGVIAGLLVLGGLLKQLSDTSAETLRGTELESAAPEVPKDRDSEKPGGVMAPDRTRTIDPEKCSDPMEDSSDPKKVQGPDLRYKDVLSVKECLRAAGWTWTEERVDDPQWAKDTVIGQFPGPRAAVEPRNQRFELQVSTGKAG